MILFVMHAPPCQKGVDSIIIILTITINHLVKEGVDSSNVDMDIRLSLSAE